MVLVRVCDDCKQFPECPGAMERALKDKTDETKNLFKKAHCGYGYSGQRRIAMVSSDE